MSSRRAGAGLSGKSKGASDHRLRLADRIRHARRSAKLSQTELARRVGVTPSAAAQWEHPHGTSPGVQRLQAIATATGVVFDWLVTGSGDRRRGLRGAEQEDATLKLDFFAQDGTEEELLTRFRALSPRARHLVLELMLECSKERRLDSLQVKPGKA